MYALCWHSSQLFCFAIDQESCSDNNAGCTHGCIQGPFGAQCTCPMGYQLSNDSKTCEDVDECRPLGICSQHCFNERGSFRCHCQDGYTLEADGRTCKASGLCFSTELWDILTDISGASGLRGPTGPAQLGLVQLLRLPQIRQITYMSVTNFLTGVIRW